MTLDVFPIRRAFLSVSDKTDIIAFARTLHSLHIEIISTGGTASTLSAEGIPVTDVSAVTDFPEIMNGRVKTLHPRIHGALLGRSGIDDVVMDTHKIVNIDLLVVNLYPFEKTIAQPSCSISTAIENIDIGGPAMVRSGAKNFSRVAVVTSPKQYANVSQLLLSNGGQLDQATRFALAATAFNVVAQYDAAISNYLSSISNVHEQIPVRNTYPQQLNQTFSKMMDLRYGENPHQTAALYRDNASKGSFAAFLQIQGKELSYNNIADAYAAWDCVQQFASSACVIVKHANPCGVALSDTCIGAYETAYRADPTSAFGGIIAFNTCVDEDTIAKILDRQFVEVIIAPEYTPQACARAQRKANVRILTIPNACDEDIIDTKRLGPCQLVQSAKRHILSEKQITVLTKRTPTPSEMKDLLFAWHVAASVKSNAIVYAHNCATVGIGAGQMSRIDAARIATLKAGDAKLSLAGAVMASDAFLPFRDSVDEAARAGITAVIQPGGSMRDEEVICAADAHDIAMVATGMRHFRH